MWTRFTRFFTLRTGAKGIARNVVERAIHNSFCFGLFDQNNRQVGFARIVSDGITHAHLKDVYVLSEHRGQGLGSWLVETLLSHRDLKDVKGWMLATSDMHALYAKHGFTALPNPDQIMTRTNPTPPDGLGEFREPSG